MTCLIKLLALNSPTAASQVLNWENLLEQVSALLANGARQIRKPSGDLITYAMNVLGIDDPKSILMVGDQYLTDVASANLAGARSAKVRTFRRDTFPASIRFSQRLEQALNGLMRLFR